MSNSPHRIRRLRCLVSTNSQTEAFAIRQCLRDRALDTLIPAFASAFDEIAHSVDAQRLVVRHRTIHIPKLEFHLKVSSLEELWEVLPELIPQQLNDQLQSLNGQTTPTTQKQVIPQATEQQNQFANLLHYLQTGSVPWHIAHASTLEIAVDFQEICIQQRSQLINYLSTQPQTAAFHFRLLQLLPKSESFAFINTLIEGIPPAWRTSIAEFISFVLDTGQSRLDFYNQCQILAVIISQSLSQAQQQQQPDFSSILNKVLSQVGIERNAFIDLLPAAAALLFQPQPSSNRPTTSTPNPPAFENQEIILTGDEALRSPRNPDSIDLFANTSISSDEALRSPRNSDLIDLFANTSISSDEALRSPHNPDSIDLFDNTEELSNQQPQLSFDRPTTSSANPTPGTPPQKLTSNRDRIMPKSEENSVTHLQDTTQSPSQDYLHPSSFILH